jgi:hypothetical protein
MGALLLTVTEYHCYWNSLNEWNATIIHVNPFLIVYNKNLYLEAVHGGSTVIIALGRLKQED